MNKSLLAVMAIMPTLLVGCKSSETIKDMAFEDIKEIIFDSDTDIEKANLITKPAVDNLKFTLDSEYEAWETCVSVKYESSEEKGKYAFIFTPLKKYSDKGDGFRLIVSCQKITTYIDLKWNYQI